MSTAKRKSRNQKGLTVPILLFVAAVGLIAFFVIASITPFRDTLYNRLFPKPPSHAAEDYFPLGVFESDNVTNSREKFEALIADFKAHSLDTVMWMVQGPLEDPNVIRLKGYPHTKLGYLDIPDRENFNVILNPSNPLHSQWFNSTATASADINGARSVAKPLVDKLKSHPSIKGYYVADEPGLELKDKVALITQAFREEDSSRPAFPVLIGVDRVGPIFAAAQPAVMTVDVYPYGASNSTCNLDMTGFGYAPGQEDFVSYIRKVTRDKPVGTPLWIILQAHKFLSPGERFALREPSKEELRLESWLSIGEGVKGIFYFMYSTQQGWTGLKDNPALFDEIKRFAERIGPLRSTLVGLHRIDDNSFLVTGNNYISTLTNSDGSKKYLVVVNKSCSPQNITVNSTISGQELKNLETNAIHAFGSSINFEGGDGRVFEVVNSGVNPTPSPSSSPSGSPAPTVNPTQTPTPSNTGSISGYIYKDNNRNSIRDTYGAEGFARATITAVGGNINRTVTSSNGGYYIFRNLPAGTYTIKVIKPNPIPSPYVLTSDTLNISLNNEALADNNFRLIPAASPTPTPTSQPTATPNPNLLNNGDFEDSLSGWNCQGTGSGTCTIAIGNTRPASPHFVELIPKGEAWGRQVGQANILTTLGQSETFCLSGYVNKSGNAYVVLAIQNPINYGLQIDAPASGVVGSWSLIKKTVTKPHDWPGNKLAVYVRNYTSNVKVSIDDISLTRGACQ